MRSNGLKRIMLATLMVIASSGAAARGGLIDRNAVGGDPSALEAAHAAYLQRDFMAMTIAVRRVLESRDSDMIERRNALELLRKASDESDGRLPLDWRLPAGVSKLKFSEIRKDQPDGVFFKHKLSADIVAKDTVTQVRLVRYPDQVVLDRRAGVGEWEVSPEDGAYMFDLQSRDQTDALPDGLYLIDLELKGGDVTRGWFIVTDVESSASPTVTAPAVGETVTHGNPELRWGDFCSPEYKPSEQRALALGIVKIAPTPVDWDVKWEAYYADPVATSAVVGLDPAGIGVTHLDDGQYWATVTYWESRQMGDVKIRRGSRTGRHFYVKTAQ